jgi:hypothetical protein
MKKATKGKVLMGCVFILVSAINLIMEYRKTNPSGLLLNWIGLIFFTILTLVAFIRYNNRKTEEINNQK